MNPLVEQILRLRKDSHMTDVHLEAVSGVSASTVRYWKKQGPTLSSFEAVANSLGYDVTLVKRNG